ncbi:hypothetical protein WA158_007284 [Blastocystis sp. Blastoise]
MKRFIKDMHSKHLPWHAYLPVILVVFMDYFCYQLLAPNIPFIIQYYISGIHEGDIGYYSGFLTASYYIGSTFGNLFWGWYSDQVGRRKCFLTSLFFVFICMNMFGFASNYYTGIYIRGIWGFMNGNIATAKTYIGEICNHYTQPLGYSLFISAIGLAYFLGSFLSGILSQPTEYFPWLVTTIPILKDYPFYLPCFVGSMMIFITAVIITLYLPETLTHNQILNIKETKSLIKHSMGHHQLKTNIYSNPNLSTIDIELILWSKDNIISLIKDKTVLTTAFLYGLVAIVQGAEDSFYPLWLLNAKEEGGFEFDQIYISILLPLLTQLYTYTQIYSVSIIAYGTLLLSTPVALTIVQSFVLNLLYSITVLSRLFTFAYPPRYICLF